LINYESSLVRFFGENEALGTELRFPLFVSTITADAVQAVKRTRAQVPRGTLDWIQDFEASLEAGITADQRFDFRIYLIPHTGPKSTADAALTFVRADDFTPEQNAIMDQVQTIVREKKVPVEDLNGMLPSAVVEQVGKRLDRPLPCMLTPRRGGITESDPHPAPPTHSRLSPTSAATTKPLVSTYSPQPGSTTSSATSPTTPPTKKSCGTET
jgi:hypothetical protein